MANQYNKHMVEIGCTGKASLHAFLEPDCLLEIFEPSPQHLAKIREIYADYSNVRIHPYAIWKERGQLLFHDQGATSFVEGVACPAICNDWPVQNNVITVEARTFDEFDDGSVSMMDIDTEGSEFYVLEKLISRPEVIVIEMLPRVVPVEDEDISKELERAFRKQKIRVETGARADNIQKIGKCVRLTLTTKDGKQEQLDAEKLLVAVGRKPNTENIGIENTRVELDRGFIKVNPYQQTGEPGVYAIGDVVAGTPQLAHVATMEGMIAVAHMAGKPATPINKNRIPGCTYTEPGIGSVGLTEAQARAQGYQVRVGRFPFAGNSRATILGKHEGFIKVVADEKFGEILGVHIIGPEAFELIAEAVTAMNAEATVETMMQTIHAHPTLYEAVGEAFNAVYGLSINA